MSKENFVEQRNICFPVLLLFIFFIFSSMRTYNSIYCVLISRNGNIVISYNQFDLVQSLVHRIIPITSWNAGLEIIIQLWLNVRSQIGWKYNMNDDQDCCQFCPSITRHWVNGSIMNWESLSLFCLSEACFLKCLSMSRFRVSPFLSKGILSTPEGGTELVKN